MSDVTNTLQQRGNRYGEFETHAHLAQHLKEGMRFQAPGGNWYALAPEAREALDMIQHKVARILNGDPTYKDNWHDIAGYATLVEQALTTDTLVVEDWRRSGLWGPDPFVLLLRRR